MSPLDLHVLSTPPAFVLSQDQTLMFNPFPHSLLSAFSSPKPPASLQQIRRLLSQNLTVLFYLIYSLTVSFSRIVAKIGTFVLAQRKSYYIKTSTVCQALSAFFLAFSFLHDIVFDIVSTPLHIVIFHILPSFCCHSGSVN